MHVSVKSINFKKVYNFKFTNFCLFNYSIFKKIILYIYIIVIINYLLYLNNK